VDYRRETCPCKDAEFAPPTRACKHLICIGILYAVMGRRVDQDRDQDHEQPHICNHGWVSMGVEDEDGETEEALYLCQRCAKDSHAPVRVASTTARPPNAALA